MHWRRNDDSIREVSFRLEAHGVRPVLDYLDFAIDVYVAVLALHPPIRKPGLQLERAVRTLVAVGVRTILVVLIDLFEDLDLGGRLKSARSLGSRSRWGSAPWRSATSPSCQRRAVIVVLEPGLELALLAGGEGEEEHLSEYGWHAGL